MGQSLNTLLARGSEDKKMKEIEPIIQSCYQKYFADADQIQTEVELYHGICLTVQEINDCIGNMQFRLPTVENLQKVYQEHHRGMKVTKEEFQKIMRELIVNIKFSGVVPKEAILYIFGVPLTTLFLKQRTMPNAIPDGVFIPAITSITFLVLAGLNKI